MAFLDRDGTINVDDGYIHKVEDWQWCEGAIEGLKKLSEAGFTLAIITNQSGVGHDMYTEEDVDNVHEHMTSELEKHGVEFAAIAYCSHDREAGCDCRKPKTGMLKDIEPKVGEIDFENSWTIGDKFADVGFGKNLGTHTALIRSKYWSEDEMEDTPDIVVGSLLEAAEHITS